MSCHRKSCYLMIANKTTGTLRNRPSVTQLSSAISDEVIVYDFVGTRAQATLSVYGKVAERLFNDMGQATIEWRMSANGSMQKVGPRFQCERTVRVSGQKNEYDFSCSFYIEDKATGKIGPAPLG